MENKTVKIISRNYKYQKTYGGKIKESDFDIDHGGTRDVANRIVSDWKFDRTCKCNIASGRKNIGSFKN